MLECALGSVEAKRKGYGDMTDISMVVLAAGMGTRMRSKTPKVLHKAAGRSMLGHVLAAAAGASPQRAIVITAPDAPQVADEATRWLPGAQTLIQTQRKGTAHAVSFARSALEDFSGVTVVLYGDVPLIRTATIMDLARKVSKACPLCVLGFEAADPKGYGRLVTDEHQHLTRIVEELDANAGEKRITLCNSGIIAIDNGLLWDLLPSIGNDNAKGEYYLTDLIGLTAQAGLKVGYAVCPEEEVMGVNDRLQLAAVEAAFQARLRERAMKNGATLIDPGSVFFSFDTEIGRDVLIEPWVFFGPGVTVADEAVIRANCVIEQAVIAQGAQIGPFARLRPGADIHHGAKVGNFVEIKKSRVEEGAKVNHFTYIGDARVGARANIGAGTITCNYDGFFKHHTDIGAGAFIGSNSALVAPVRIGDGAYVGSGSVITEDVPADALAIARGAQVEKPGWAARYRAAMQRRKAKA